MGMSKHILVESSNYFCGTYNNEEETNEELLLSLLILYQSDQGTLPDKDSTILTILHQYSVGTERTKSRILTSLRVTAGHVEHGPLRNINSNSALKTAKDQRMIGIQQSVSQNDNETETTNQIITQQIDPSYSKIMRTIIAMISILGKNTSLSCFNDLIGYKVLEGRSDFFMMLKI
jgi:hypothetical protein